MGPLGRNQTELPLDIATNACLHCNAPVPRARNSSNFCCSGCESVYQFLQSNHLEDYYTLKKQSHSKMGNPLSQLLLNQDPSFESEKALDDPTFRNENGIALEFPTLEFHIEGIHCTACVWLLEKSPEQCADILEARVNLSQHTLKIKLSRFGKFKNAVHFIRKLGYEPSPLLKKEDQDFFEKREDKLNLIRIGVAAFCAGNVMLYSIGIYGGATEKFGFSFRWLMILVSVPSIFWCALPFYRNAMGALRLKKVSIDLPMSIALLFGFFQSTYQAFIGSNEIYLDSLTSLVFLLLGSRYFLSRLRKKELSHTNLFKSLLPTQCKKRVNGTDSLVSSDTLKINDLIVVECGQSLPTDGILYSESAKIDCSLLTGESEPRFYQKGQPVFGGTRNNGETLIFKVTTLNDESKMGVLAKKIEAEQGPEVWLNDPKINKIAETFLWGVLSISTLLILTFVLKGETAEGFKRALSLMIVACPCALALATPLTLSMAYKKAADKGFVLKNPDLLLKGASIETIFFDKTGTLTKGKPEVESLEWIHIKRDSAYQNKIFSALYSLESKSAHPLAKSIVKYFENKDHITLLQLQHVIETPGKGIRGILPNSNDEMTIESTKNKNDKRTSIIVRLNLEDHLRITFQDPIREEAPSVLDQLKKLNLKTILLSGDSKGIVQSVAKETHCDEFKSECTPEDKADLLSHEKNSLMIGDGANDALALKKATIGVAMKGALSVTSQAADALITINSLQPLFDFLKISKKTKTILMINFGVSILYNLMGVTLALTGDVTPLVAAIIMPVSSISVLLISSIGMKERAS